MGPALAKQCLVTAPGSPVKLGAAFSYVVPPFWRSKPMWEILESFDFFQVLSNQKMKVVKGL